MNKRKERNCAVCHTDINTRRVDAITCSDKCRARLSRKRTQQSVLVRFRVPITIYTNLVASAFTTHQSINDYLMNLVEGQNEQLHCNQCSL